MTLEQWLQTKKGQEYAAIAYIATLKALEYVGSSTGKAILYDALTNNINSAYNAHK